MSFINHIFFFDVLLGIEVIEHEKLLEYGLNVSFLFITVQERDCHFVNVVFQFHYIALSEANCSVLERLRLIYDIGLSLGTDEMTGLADSDCLSVRCRWGNNARIYKYLLANLIG